MHVNVWTDGGVRTGGVKGPTQGQSGRGGVGFVIKNDEGALLRKGGMEIGDDVTVNECEFSGVIYGLFNAHTLGATRVTLRTDSQLVAMQLLGKWKCKKAHLQEYLAEAKKEMARFERVEIVWVPREQNQHADQITREALGS